MVGRAGRSVIATGGPHRPPTAPIAALTPAQRSGGTGAIGRIATRPARAYADPMGRFLPVIIVALLTIYCVVEVAQANPYTVRRMPRWLWATAIICVPMFGAVGWLF